MNGPYGYFFLGRKDHTDIRRMGSTCQNQVVIRVHIPLYVYVQTNWSIGLTRAFPTLRKVGMQRSSRDLGVVCTKYTYKRTKGVLPPLYFMFTSSIIFEGINIFLGFKLIVSKGWKSWTHMLWVWTLQPLFFSLPQIGNLSCSYYLLFY